MIKPTYLWALCKKCSDSRWIGDICRYLGGQEIELDFGQRQVAEMIQMDSEWMDERINWNREAARMRQAKAREKRNAEREAQGKASREVTDVTHDNRDNGASREVTPSSRQSVHPSVHPLKINNTPPPPAGGGSALDGAFENFWKAYPRECPRKVDKIKCRQKFARLVSESADAEAFIAEVMAGLDRWKRSDTWTRDGGAFIRSPLVWLNNSSWLDEPKAAAENQSAGGDVMAEAWAEANRMAREMMPELRRRTAPEAREGASTPSATPGTGKDAPGAENATEGRSGGDAAATAEGGEA